MSSFLHFALEEYPTNCIAEDRTYELLRDFLQPDCTESVEAMSYRILALLPDEKAPNSHQMQEISETLIDLAEQIPYHHPSQLKLVDLLEHLGSATKFTQTCRSKVTETFLIIEQMVIFSKITDMVIQNSNEQFHYRYQKFGELLRDQLDGAF